MDIKQIREILPPQVNGPLSAETMINAKGSIKENIVYNNSVTESSGSMYSLSLESLLAAPVGILQHMFCCSCA
jgi:hypothetical protein